MTVWTSAMGRFIAIGFATVVLVTGAAGAQAAPGNAADRQAGDEPLRVVASFSILGDIVREVGGDRVAVSMLVSPDGDAHAYEPRPGDAKRLADARLLFVNGLDFEVWLPRLMRASAFRGVIVVASKGVTPRRLDAGGDDGHRHAARDPHAWQNLANGLIYVRNVADGLAAADPAHAAGYRQRASAYAARIEALDIQARQLFTAIPAARRKVVTTHDAFGYFGQAYGVTFISAVELSTDAEPSAAQMARIIEQVRKENVPAVFVENISSPRLVRQIALETGAKVGGTLYSDALTKAGQPGVTYLGMMQWNIRQIGAALQP